MVGLGNIRNEKRNIYLPGRGGSQASQSEINIPVIPDEIRDVSGQFVSLTDSSHPELPNKSTQEARKMLRKSQICLQQWRFQC